MILPTGTRLGPYTIVAPLGAGGMGQVYRAHDTRLDRDVAVKFVADDLLRDPSAVDRFVREARAASALNHPNIVTIYEIGEAEAGRFIVMELVHGYTLRELPTRQPSTDTLMDIAAQIARALSVAHAAGIIHRDIKPENVMVREDGYVKLLDFGLARLRPATISQDSRVTSSGTAPGLLLGTVRYMSPEQARGEPADSTSDIFSLGVVLYELATGFHPFLADSPIAILHAILSRVPVPPTRLNPEMPAAIEGLLLQMLGKDPRLRPTATEVETKLSELRRRPEVAVTRTTGAAARRHTVGREPEVAQLFGAFDWVAAGHGLLIAVAGEPGIGKTTLVEEFLDQLAGRRPDVPIARGRCSERLAGTEAYLPFLEAADSFLHGEGGESAAHVMRLLAPTWYRRLAPFAGDQSSAVSAADTRASSQDRMKREFGAFLQELSRTAPLCIFLEDMHWADASTVDLLDYLANRFAALPAMIVVTSRPTELLLAEHPFLPIRLDLQGRGLCREIELGFLSPEDVARFVTLEFPEHEFPPAFVGLVHAKTEGSPLFMVDLVRDLRRRGIIVQDRGRWQLAQSMLEIERELPESVRSMIQRKIDAVRDEERRLLVAASVQGYEFDSAVVARALGIDQADTEDRFDALERTHAFVRFAGEKELPDRTLTVRYRFVHVLYQNVLYGSLRATRRAALSGAVARTLLSCHAGQTTAIASQLALLFEAARDYWQAAEHFLAAAQQAAKVFANHEAATLARRGLEMLRAVSDDPDRQRRELQLQIVLAGALTALKGYADPEVAQAYTRARELCRLLGETPQLFPVLNGLYRYYIVRGELHTARDLGEQLLAIAESVNDPALLLEAHRAVGTPLFYMGEFARALGHMEHALSLYDPQKHRSHIVLYGAEPALACLTWKSFALWFLGFPDGALAASREAVRISSELGHPFSRAYALVLASWFYHYRREPDAVQRHAEQAIAVSTEHGFAQWLAVATMMRGWARCAAGGPAAGLEELRAGLSAFRATGGVLNLPHFLALLGEALARTDQLEEASSVINEALSIASRNGDRCYEAELSRLEGEFMLRQDRPDADVEESFQQALEIARRQGARSLELRAAASLAQLYARLDRADEGRRLLAEVYRSFTEGFETPDLQQARALLG